MVTLVVDLPVTKLDALDVLAFVCDGSVEGAGTAHPRVWLSAQVWAEVEIPKFADPPPIAVDVHGPTPEAVRTAAARLAAALRRVGWDPHPAS